MKTTITPQVEKVKKPRAKKIVDQETLAATASTITRKREAGKRVRVAPPINIPLESTFARAENNTTRDLEEISVPVINPEYGTLIDPNNFEASQNRIKEAEERGEITLLEEVGTDDFEEKHIQEAHETRNHSYNESITPGISNKERSFYKTSDSERTSRNTKTFSDSKVERNDRGTIRKFWDKLMDYVAPKDLYDEDEQADKFNPLAQQYEKEQAAKAAREIQEQKEAQELKAAQDYKLRYSAPDILNSKLDSKNDDDQFSGRMAA